MSCAKHRQQELEEQRALKDPSKDENLTLLGKELSVEEKNKGCTVEVDPLPKARKKIKSRWDSPEGWNVVVVDRINKRDVRIYRSIDLIPEGFCGVCHVKVTIKTPIRVDTLWGKTYNGKCDRCGFGVNVEIK